MDADAVGAGIDPAPQSELDAPVQAFCIRLGRLRKDDREAAVPEVARNVGGANGSADPVAGRDEVCPSPCSRSKTSRLRRRSYRRARAISRRRRASK